MGGWRAGRAVLLATVVTVLGLTVLGSPAPAAAVEGPASSYVRVGHLSPDTPAVDVVAVPLAGSAPGFTVENLTYPAVGSYRRVEPGTWRVDVHAAGTRPDGQRPLASVVLTTEPGAAYTVAAAGPRSALAVHVIDDMLATTDPGAAGLRVVNATLRDPLTVAAPWVNRARRAAS